MSSFFKPSAPGGAITPQAAPKMPKPPAPPRVVRMPTETDPDIINAAKRRRVAALQRTGRMSTILTDQTGSDTLGG